MIAARKNLRLARVDAEALPTVAPGPSTQGGPSTTERIVAAVTQAVVEHRLQPGAKLVEQTLGDRFGVSRTIVRQALIRLAQLKLVRLEPARGAFVAQPSIDEAREVFAVRRMVEGQMLRELVERARPADLRRLKAHLRAEREAVRRIDVALRTQRLFDFHVGLAEMLGNRVLTELIQELVSRCSLITLMHQSSDDATDSHRDHAAIVRAIEARDADEAIRLMDAHLNAVEHGLIEHPRTNRLRLTETPRP